MIIRFGDGLAGPVLVDVAHLELFVVTAERAIVGGHRTYSSTATSRAGRVVNDTKPPGNVSPSITMRQV